MKLVEDLKNDIENEINESVISEDDFKSDYQTPLKEFEEYDRKEPEREKNTSFDDNEETEKQPDKAAIKKINEVTAIGIVGLVNNVAAYGFATIAMSEDTEKYKAKDEDLKNLEKSLGDYLPDDKVIVPSWGQLIIFILIAFLPGLLLALADRKQNKENAELRKQIRDLKIERKRLRIKKFGNEVAKEAQTINNENKQNATA